VNNRQTDMADLGTARAPSVDDAKILPFLMLLVCLTAFLEGFDAQIQGYVAPAIIKLWHIHKAAFGPVFVSFQFGFLLGAVGLGGFGDRIGRKRLIAGNVLLFGVFTLAGGFAPSVWSLAATRFLSALFLGGTIPNAIALVVDYSPQRRPAVGIGIMYVIYAMGGAAGGFLSAMVVPALGWQSIFWGCGGLAAAYSVLLFLFLPESRHFQKSPTATPVVETPWARHLFANGRLWMTVSLWAAFCANQIALQFSNSWMPTLFSGAGMGYARSVAAGGLFQAGGALGSLVCGFLLGGKAGLRWLTVFSLMAVPTVFLLGQAMGIGPLLSALALAAGFCIIGSQTGLNASAGFLYPATLRSTGAGWANGIGRIGSMVGPLMGAGLIQLDLPVGVVFMIAAVPSLCVALLVTMAGKTRPQDVFEKAREQ